jgi:hypothetical protein
MVASLGPELLRVEIMLGKGKEIKEQKSEEGRKEASRPVNRGD